MDKEAEYESFHCAGENVNEASVNIGELKEETIKFQGVSEKAKMLGKQQKTEETDNSNENEYTKNREYMGKDALDCAIVSSDKEEMKEETDGFYGDLSEETFQTGTHDEKGCIQSCNVIIKTEAEDTALCPVCNLSFPECEMSEHLIDHDNDLQHNCHICKLTLSDEHALNNHVSGHGSGKQHVCHAFTKKGNLDENVKIQYKEDEHDASSNTHLAAHGRICERNISEEDICKHTLNHTGERTFVCQLCFLSFGNQEHLSEHFNYHTHESPSKCIICETDCITKSALQNHMLLHASNNASQKKKCSVSQTKIVAPKAYAKHKLFCPFCGKFCSSKFALDLHLKLCSRKCQEVCKICKESFSDEERYKEHVLSHDPEKPYRCEICDRCFKLSGSLRNHRATHLENKPHVCQHCGKGFIKPCFLRAHEASHSEDRDRPFICNVCKRGFTKAYNLKKHKKTHEPAESKELFTCNVCGMSMTIKSSLERHMLKHTGKNKLHRCELCTKWYSTSHALKLHMYTHTGELPHKCGICDKRFSEPNRVKRHMRVHTGERAYMCSICDKAYKCQQDLNHHLTKHTGERKYLCNECGNAFPKHRDLKYHMKSKHDIDITNKSNVDV